MVSWWRLIHHEIFSWWGVMKVHIFGEFINLVVSWWRQIHHEIFSWWGVMKIHIFCKQDFLMFIYLIFWINYIFSLHLLVLLSCFTTTLKAFFSYGYTKFSKISVHFIIVLWFCIWTKSQIYTNMKFHHPHHEKISWWINFYHEKNSYFESIKSLIQ